MIVEAYTDLLAEGHRSPSAQAVAERAGVGIRTVYNQFADLESIRAEAGVTVYWRLEPHLLRPEDVDPQASLDDRLRLFLDRRLHVLSVLDPLAQSVQGRHASSPALSENRGLLVAAGLEELRTVFGPELRALPARSRSTLLHTLHLASSWPALLALREELGLSPAQVRTTMSEALRRLLTAPPGVPTRSRSQESR